MAVSAFSAVRRGSRKEGKHDPLHSSGMRSSTVPALVSQSRSRRPLRCTWRAGQHRSYTTPWDTTAAANPRRSVPAELSRTDPAAAWSSRTVRGRFGYALNVLIDTPSGVALDVKASPARFAAEVDAERDMLARAAERFGYQPKRVAADWD